MANREIEVIRCWDDNTWDTHMLEIPWFDGETDDCELRQTCEEVTMQEMRHSAELPVYVGIYHIPEVEEVS